MEKQPSSGKREETTPQGGPIWKGKGINSGIRAARQKELWKYQPGREIIHHLPARDASQLSKFLHIHLQQLAVLQELGMLKGTQEGRLGLAKWSQGPQPVPGDAAGRPGTAEPRDMPGIPKEGASLEIHCCRHDVST